MREIEIYLSVALFVFSVFCMFMSIGQQIDAAKLEIIEAINKDKK